MRRRIRLAVLGSAVVVLVAGVMGCSSEPGHAQPAGGGGPAAPSGSPAPGGVSSGGAPPIMDPMPEGTLDGDPCAALTPAQVKELLATPAEGRWDDTGMAHACHWGNLDRGSSVGVQFLYGWSSGISQAYANRNQGFFEELEPVQGYPAVAYGQLSERPDGRCGVAVGLSDTMAFEADVTTSRSKVGKSDPCVAAHRVADDVVTTLRGDA